MKFEGEITKQRIDIHEDVLDKIADHLGWQIQTLGNMVFLTGTEKDPNPSWASNIFGRIDKLGVIQSEIRRLDAKISDLEKQIGVCSKCGRSTKKK